MRADGCREWRETLGAYVLDHLSDEERVGVDAHLQGCPACRAEVEALGATARLLPQADPGRFGPAPAPPPALGERVLAQIEAEGRARRRLRRGFALSGAGAVAIATMLAIVVLGRSGDAETPAHHVSFTSLPPGIEIGATLEPHPFGTEVHVYVKGAPSGTLCRVFLRARDGTRLPAGSFRYRWGDDSQAILSSALELARTSAIGIRVGNRTFVAPVAGARRN